MRVLFLFCTILFASISSKIICDNKTFPPKTNEEISDICEKIENSYSERLKKQKKYIKHIILGMLDAKEAGVKYDTSIFNEAKDDMHTIGKELNQLFIESSKDQRVLISLQRLGAEFATANVIGEETFNQIED